MHTGCPKCYVDCITGHSHTCVTKNELSTHNKSGEKKKRNLFSRWHFSALQGYNQQDCIIVKEEMTKIYIQLYTLVSWPVTDNLVHILLNGRVCLA
jgi:hypothetical protein